MSSPLIDALSIERGWPLLATPADLELYIQSHGNHCLFVPGDPKKNLESNDVAVILPELVMSFQGLFDCAVVGDDIERSVRDRFDVWPTPSLIFVRDGVHLGAVPKVRDWDDYLTRIPLILAGDGASAAA